METIISTTVQSMVGLKAYWGRSSIKTDAQ